MSFPGVVVDEPGKCRRDDRGGKAVLRTPGAKPVARRVERSLQRRGCARRRRRQRDRERTATPREGRKALSTATARPGSGTECSRGIRCRPTGRRRAAPPTVRALQFTSGHCRPGSTGRTDKGRLRPPSRSVTGAASLLMRQAQNPGPKSTAHPPPARGVLVRSNT